MAIIILLLEIIITIMILSLEADDAWSLPASPSPLVRRLFVRSFAPSFLPSFVHRYECPLVCPGEYRGEKVYRRCAQSNKGPFWAGRERGKGKGRWRGGRWCQAIDWGGKTLGNIGKHWETSGNTTNESSHVFNHFLIDE